MKARTILSARGHDFNFFSKYQFLASIPMRALAGEEGESKGVNYFIEHIEEIFENDIYT